MAATTSTNAVAQRIMVEPRNLCCGRSNFFDDRTPRAGAPVLSMNEVERCMAACPNRQADQADTRAAMAKPIIRIAVLATG